MGSCCGNRKIQLTEDEQFIIKKMNQQMAIKKMNPELRISQNKLMKRRKNQQSQSQDNEQKEIQTMKPHLHLKIAEPNTAERQNKDETLNTSFQEAMTGVGGNTPVMIIAQQNNNNKSRQKKPKNLLDYVKEKKPKIKKELIS